jgi:hypothetical protein
LEAAIKVTKRSAELAPTDNVGFPRGNTGDEVLSGL